MNPEIEALLRQAVRNRAKNYGVVDLTIQARLDAAGYELEALDYDLDAIEETEN